MRNTTKVAIVLALAALTLVILVPMAAGGSTRSNASAQAPTVGSQSYPAGYQNYPAVTSHCQDSAALVTGYDPITGLPCPQASP